MKEEVNALIFGIRCNFPKQCGKERTEEAVKLIKELERLARIGKATEKWFSVENSYQNQEIDGFFNSCQELLEWADRED